MRCDAKIDTYIFSWHTEMKVENRVIKYLTHLWTYIAFFYFCKTFFLYFTRKDAVDPFNCMRDELFWFRFLNRLATIRFTHLIKLNPKMYTFSFFLQKVSLCTLAVSTWCGGSLQLCERWTFVLFLRYMFDTSCDQSQSD